MNQGMKKQRGAALIVVLALLAGALIVGVSGMQSSLIDERLAGNYRASAQAQMNAEQTVAAALAEGFFAPGNWSDPPGTEWLEEKEGSDEWIEAIKGKSYSELKKIEKTKEEEFSCKQTGDKASSSYPCFYFPLKGAGDDGPEKYLVAVGAVSDKADEKLLASRVIMIEEKRGKEHKNIPDYVDEAFSQYTVYAEETDTENVTIKGKTCIKESGCITGLGFDYGDFKEQEEEQNQEYEDGNYSSNCDSLSGDLGGGVCKSSKDDIEDLDISNGTVIFSGFFEVKGDVNLENVIIASNSEIKLGVGGSSFDIKDSYIITSGKIDIDFEKPSSINGGYFYSGGKEMVINFDESPVPFCGSIISRGEVKLDGERRATFSSSCGRKLIWH